MIASESSSPMTISECMSKTVAVVERELHIPIFGDYPILKLFNQYDELLEHHNKIEKERNKKKK